MEWNVSSARSMVPVWVWVCVCVCVWERARARWSVCKCMCVCLSESQARTRYRVVGTYTLVKVWASASKLSSNAGHAASDYPCVIFVSVLWVCSCVCTASCGRLQHQGSRPAATLVGSLVCVDVHTLKHAWWRGGREAGAGAAGLIRVRMH